MTGLLPDRQPFATLPPALAAASPEAWQTILQYFAAEIANPNTRRAYSKAAEQFLHFAATRGAERLEAVGPLHVAGWLASLEAAGTSVPTIKQRLAAIRGLFQALARDRIVAANPAALVRGPRHSVRRGKTPVLAPEEARAVLDAIATNRLAGLRDRALIATMLYTFARIGAVTAMLVEDVYTERRRLWLRLHEKGGKRLEIPCHHKLEHYLGEYLDAAGIAGQPKLPLFQTLDMTAAGEVRGERLSGKPLSQPIAFRIMQRRTAAAGIATRIGNHSWRATGITTYLNNGGTIERAAAIAAHASTRTTQIYDRRPDDVALEEIERIQV